MATKMDINEMIGFEDMITESNLPDLMNFSQDSLRPAEARSVYFLVGSSCIICKNGK